MRDNPRRWPIILARSASEALDGRVIAIPTSSGIGVSV